MSRKNEKNNLKMLKNQKLPRILKVAENRKNCRKVAEQLMARPSIGPIPGGGGCQKVCLSTFDRYMNPGINLMI